MATYKNTNKACCLKPLDLCVILSTQWKDDRIISALIGIVAAQVPSSLLLDNEFVLLCRSSGHLDRAVRYGVKTLFGQLDRGGTPMGARSPSFISNVEFIDNKGSCHWVWTKVEIWAKEVALLHAGGLYNSVGSDYLPLFTRVLDEAYSMEDVNKNTWFSCCESVGKKR